MAPEQLAAHQGHAHAPLTTKMDAWALGTIMLELLGAAVQGHAPTGHARSTPLVRTSPRACWQGRSLCSCTASWRTTHIRAARLDVLAQAAEQDLLAYEAFLANMHIVMRGVFDS